MLNPQWNDYTSYQNGKAAGYMLTSENWNHFCDTKYAIYAIGGPTIEMFADSYNEKYGDSIEIPGISNYGYECWELENLNINDRTYIISESIDYSTGSGFANGYWTSSPDSQFDNYLYCIDCDGKIERLQCTESRSYADFRGFRPIVCLQSGVKLEKVSEDGGVSHYMLIKK